MHYHIDGQKPSSSKIKKVNVIHKLTSYYAKNCNEKRKKIQLWWLNVYNAGSEWMCETYEDISEVDFPCNS